MTYGNYVDTVQVITELLARPLLFISGLASNGYVINTEHFTKIHLCNICRLQPINKLRQMTIQTF